MPGSLTAFKPPIDYQSIHFCSEVCIQITPSERLLIELMVVGLTNDQIAARMDLNLQTVRNKYEVVMRRLHLHNRTQLAVVALASGLTKIE